MTYPVCVEGDILDQDVEVIVNSWNRNIIPWWLLLLQGVSGAIKRSGGTGPFREVARYGPIPLGEARMTGAGTLPFKAIIHVAGINMLWHANEYSITNSVVNAMSIVNAEEFGSVAFPLIGAGSGTRGEESSLKLMMRAFAGIRTDADVRIVRYRVNS